MTEPLLTWGDVVRVFWTAPEALKSGRIGSVYAADTVQSDDYGKELGLALGPTIISVAFPDTSTNTAAPNLLRRENSTR